MLLRPFGIAPAIGLAVTTTASASAALPGRGNTLRVVNEGPNVAFLSIGTGAQTAVVPTASPLLTAQPFAVGDVTISIPSDAVLNFSAICRALQSATITLQVGEGV